MTDLRTEWQKQCDARATKVVSIFLKLKKEKVKGSMNAKLNHISEVMSADGEYISPVGVKNILKRNGLYEL